jgi:hypothetical protein
MVIWWQTQSGAHVQVKQMRAAAIQQNNFPRARAGGTPLKESSQAVQQTSRGF